MIKAYHMEKGMLDVKEWMRYNPDHSYIVNGVAKLSLPDEFWDKLKEQRK